MHTPSDLNIVGLGASAGGLEALEAFFRGVPADSGLAFVVVQHLDPTHEGLLPELLQRATPMPVQAALDGQALAADEVYVITPNTELTLEQGVLRVNAPVPPRGQRLPIDLLLSSLAADRGERAVGVVLSGMGSDGTRGLGAIKASGGATLVQAPASAKFDAMPASAIAAGFADVIARPEELGARVTEYARPRSADGPSRELPSDTDQELIRQICMVVRHHTGHDFSLYKPRTVERRIERRIRVHQLPDLAAYLHLIEGSGPEVGLLFKELLIGVTSFFRDPDVWTHVAENALPELLAACGARGVVRVWVPACSTGEEAYTLAILLHEALGELSLTHAVTVHVFGTDLDHDSIVRARRGHFGPEIAQDVSEARLRKYFVRDEHGFRVTQELRDMLVFATHDLLTDPPLTRMDLVSCRNVLIYLTPELQRRVLPLFHLALNPGGTLVLGNAETLGSAEALFTATAQGSRVYRRVGGAVRSPTSEPVLLSRPTPVGPLVVRAPPTIQATAELLLLTRYAPSAVVTNERGDILYVSGRTGAYLEPAAGKANWNIHAMGHEELRSELNAAFQQALRAPGAGPVKTRARAGPHAVEIIVDPIEESPAQHGLLLVVFSTLFDYPPEPLADTTRDTSPELRRLQSQLRQAREDARVTRLEMQRSHEELLLTNTELQSTNEQLQSTNEELTTSKEEMQSLNEELQTLNTELQSKLDELSRAQDDMRNLLDSTAIGTLFLDDQLRVRRFTAQMTQIIRLIDSDVGRPITDLATTLSYPALPDDARAVVATLVVKETQAEAVDGRWYSVRIMPYRTVDDRVDGVVITFTDVTRARLLESTLRLRQEEP